MKKWVTAMATVLCLASVLVLALCGAASAGLEVQVEKLAHQCGGSPPLVISAAASRGLDALLAAVWRELGIS